MEYLLRAVQGRQLEQTTRGVRIRVMPLSHRLLPPNGDETPTKDDHMPTAEQGEKGIFGFSSHVGKAGPLR